LRGKRTIEILKASAENFFVNFINFTKRQKKVLFIYFLLCAVLIPISWQQDVYDWYYFIGKFVVEGKNVYEPINVYAIAKRGDTGRYGYPPFFLPFFSSSYIVSNFFTLPFHIPLKSFLVFINVLIAMELEKITKNSQSVSLYLFNPLIIVAAAVQGFPDVLVIYFILKAFQSLEKDSSAAYLGLSCLCKQTAWPLSPFFLMLNLNKKRLLIFFATFLGGVLPFVILNYQAVLRALVLDYSNRVGVSPLAVSSLFSFLKYIQLSPWVIPILLMLEFTLTLLLLIFIRKKLEGDIQNKVKVGKYLVFYELVTFSFLYFLAPHFLSYLLFPIIILMAMHSYFEYPYFFLTVAGYLFFIVDQGLRHNIFHYNVWAGPIYLGFLQLELFNTIVQSVMAIIMYSSFLYSFYKIRRGKA